MKMLGRLEPVQVLYTLLLVFFSVILIYCEHMFPKDGQVFQMFSNVASGFAGALLAKRSSGAADGEQPKPPLKP